MDNFLQELPTLLVTLAVLAMAVLIFLAGKATVADISGIISPVIAFWFLRGAFNWQPSQKQ